LESVNAVEFENKEKSETQKPTQSKVANPEKDIAKTSTEDDVPKNTSDIDDCKEFEVQIVTEEDSFFAVTIPEVPWSKKEMRDARKALALQHRRSAQIRIWGWNPWKKMLQIGRAKIACSQKRQQRKFLARCLSEWQT